VKPVIIIAIAFVVVGLVVLFIAFPMEYDADKTPVGFLDEVKEKKPINTNPNLEKQFSPSQKSVGQIIPSQYEEAGNEDYLFRVFIKLENVIEKDDGLGWIEAEIYPKSEYKEIYDQVGVSIEKQNTAVIYPVFTASAYKSPGFYDYYKKNCDESCLTTKIEVTLDYNNSGTGVQILDLLGYEIINDVTVHNNPEILNDYDKVIVLHNEYVTKTEYNAITGHPKVMYLYPNALYAEVEYFPDSNSITLIRGHSYPEEEISNGFDWEFDNSPLELQGDCEKWEFYQIDNGVMLNCYPDNRMIIDIELLKAIKEF